MTKCKICTNEYHEAREHCPVCGCWQSTTVMPGWTFVERNGILINLASARNAMPVKQNLYDGKVLGLRVR